LWIFLSPLCLRVFVLILELYMQRLILISLVFLSSLSFGQQNFTIAFYNVENLMDTLDNPRALDNDFLPGGKYHWNTKRYKKKQSSIGQVISGLGDQDGPEIIGLAEVENKKVLQDLVATKELKASGYSIVHYDSPDERGIDVALLYKSKSFRLISSRIYSAAFLNIKSHTRDVLLVKGVVQKDTFFVLVNHWPSRRSGKEKSEDKRIAVSIMVREALDSILLKQPNAKIIVMGDFNDEPFDKSIAIELNAKPELSSLKKGELFNPFHKLCSQGSGSVNYSHNWDMFDQILLSKGFFAEENLYHYKKAEVYHPDWMHYRKDVKAGPYRTFMGEDYKGGYSDHFPVYISLEQKK
jgi:predicted extracellular nuclease